MNTTPIDAHQGLTCAEVEIVHDVRVRQLREAQQRLRDEPRAAHPATLVRAVTSARKAARVARAETTEARAELAAVNARLAWRDEQAQARLTRQQQQDEHLAAVAGVEAHMDGRLDDFGRVAPTTIAGYRAQLTAMTCALADIARANPSILDAWRAAIVAEDTTDDTEDSE